MADGGVEVPQERNHVREPVGIEMRHVHVSHEKTGVISGGPELGVGAVFEEWQVGGDVDLNALVGDQIVLGAGPPHQVKLLLTLYTS